jgi:hypothetical protein
MNTERLYEILLKTTDQYRRGNEVTVDDSTPGLKVTHIYAMPHVLEAPGDNTHELVDVHFMHIAVNKEEAEKYREEFEALLEEYPEPDRLTGGPSYIEVGAFINSQESALRMFALGEFLKLWTVIIPASLGITGSQADKMAGLGFVMISGYKRETQCTS